MYFLVGIIITKQNKINFGLEYVELYIFTKVLTTKTFSYFKLTSNLTVCIKKAPFNFLRNP